MLKIMIVGRRHGGMTLAQLHRYMVEEHGAMVLRFIDEQPESAPRRYVQNHVFDGTFRVPDGSSDPFSVARDFVTQVWFDSPAQAQASLQMPFYQSQLRPDEERFVDQASVVKLPVAEQPIYKGHLGSGGVKLFVFYQRAVGVSVPELAEATLAVWQPVLNDRQGILQLVRNMVLPGPEGPATVDFVDEVWLKDPATARREAERWQAWAGANPRPAVLAPQALFVLLAHECVMFDGQAA